MLIDSYLQRNHMTMSAAPNTPRIRFKGFSMPWERKCLRELLVDSMDYGINAAATNFDGINKYLRITDIDEETRLFSTIDLTSPKVQMLERNYLLAKGDIVFARTGASVGKTYMYKETDGQVYFAGFLIRGKVNMEKYTPHFVFYCTQTEDYKKFVKIASRRTGQPGINAQEYENLSLLVPSYFEQQKIGDFFRRQDEIINASQEKISKLIIIKQALLQKMFAA